MCARACVCTCLLSVPPSWDSETATCPPIHTDDYYTVLGVTTDATEAQLKRAYRLRSLKYHPDKPTGSTALFQLIRTAYDTLTDTDKRRAYDEGADVNKPQDADSDEEGETQSLREEVERKYFPERYKFWPFGDPFIEKRKIAKRKAQRQAQQQKQNRNRRAWSGHTGGDY